MNVKELKALIEDMDDECEILIRADNVEYWPGKFGRAVLQIKGSTRGNHGFTGSKDFLILG
jgi:hypothetical protein